MIVACLDLEGVLIPEIWINVAERTGIDALRRTTREEPDYDLLMKQRIEILSTHGLGLPQIQEVIGTMDPLAGAVDFLDWVRRRYQLIILSDTFYQFTAPLMQALGFPTLFCHDLEIDDRGRIVDYHLRLRDQKRCGVQALHQLNLKVIASGDSYNDTSMLIEADAGILYRPPQNVIDEFPQFSVARDYDELREAFMDAEGRLQ
jgi:phosphoserine/homoserine phosphotransferase